MGSLQIIMSVLDIHKYDVTDLLSPTTFEPRFILHQFSFQQDNNNYKNSLNFIKKIYYFSTVDTLLLYTIVFLQVLGYLVHAQVTGIFGFVNKLGHYLHVYRDKKRAAIKHTWARFSSICMYCQILMLAYNTKHYYISICHSHM